MPIGEFTVEYIVLSNWIPALITVLVGGILASVILPDLQQKHSANQALANKRIEVSGNIAVAFQRYVVAWRRLIQIAEYEVSLKDGLSDEERARKMRLADSRSEHRDRLFELLSIAKAYFSKELSAQVDSFIDWDEGVSALSIQNLPKIDRWRQWERDLVTRLREEANGR